MTKWQYRQKLEDLEEQSKTCEQIKKNAKTQMGMSIAMIIISLLSIVVGVLSFLPE